MPGSIFHPTLFPDDSRAPHQIRRCDPQPVVPWLANAKPNFQVNPVSFHPKRLPIPFFTKESIVLLLRTIELPGGVDILVSPLLIGTQGIEYWSMVLADLGPSDP